MVTISIFTQMPLSLSGAATVFAEWGEILLTTTLLDL